MNKYLYKRTLVFGLLILFIGAAIAPNISGISSKTKVTDIIKSVDIEDENKEAYPTSATEWWPMWRNSPGNDGVTTSIGPNTNQLNWKTKISDEIYSAAPVVYNDNLYVSTGWYYDTIGPPEDFEKFILNPPNIDEILYDLINYKEEYFGGIYCMKSDTGEYKWKYPLYAPNDPLVVDDKVYVTDFNQYSYGSNLYCLDADDGTSNWNVPVGALVTTSTVGADDKIFLGCLDLYSYSGALKCYDSNGGLEWSYYLPGYEVIWFSAPAYCDGKVYFIASDMYSYFTGKLYCLDAETGNYLWSQMIFTFFIFSPSPVCKDGKVFVTDFNLYGYNSNLRCYNADTGSYLWQYPLGMSLSFGTPAVTDDSAYVAAMNFWYYGYGSDLYRINIDSGTLVWKVPIPGYAYFLGSSSPVCSANKLFIPPLEYYGYSGRLYCLDLDTGGIIWSYTLDYYTLAYPSIADEKVFITDYLGNIYAIEDQLKIEKISGGLLSVKAKISNIGSNDISDVSWQIDVVGGMLGGMDKHATGEINTLGGGKSKTVRAFPIIGMGHVDINVTIGMPYLSPIKKTLEGMVIGLLVIIKS